MSKCTCLPPGGSYESYEGPQRDCPEHGEPAALADRTEGDPMGVTFSRQYNLPCVVAEDGDTAQQVIDRCWDAGAVRLVDGVEFCVQLRPEIGPELWTESSLRRSIETEGEVQS